MELKNVESRIPLSNFESGLIRLSAMWPQASHLQSEARGEDAGDVRSRDGGTLERAAWSLVQCLTCNQSSVDVC